MILTALCAAAWAGPDPQALSATWDSLTPSLKAHGRLPVPSFGPLDWQNIAAGEVVKQRLPSPEGVDRAVGAGFLPYSMDAVWIGVLDDVHDDLVEDLSETWMPGTTDTVKRLYQHLDLPSPFSDRHWVILIQNTRELYQRTQGAVWERTWALDPQGPDALAEIPAAFFSGPNAPSLSGAVWTPVNDGGWYLVPVPGGVFVVYQVRTVVAGNIPDDLVVRYALSTLDELILHVGELAARAPAHYTAGHYPILRPDGVAIPVWP